MSTIRDIAKRASVSVGTASQALNGKGQVSKDTRLRVLEAARELGYGRDSRQSGKRTQLVLYMRVGDGADPFAGFFYRIVSAAMEQADALGYDLLVKSMPEGDGIPGDFAGAVVYTLAPMPVNGLISLSAQGFPLVLLGQDSPGVSCVSIDNMGGMEEAVRSLILLGHKDIAYVSPDTGSLDGMLRQKGYMAAMEGVGLRPHTMGPEEAAAGLCSGGPAGVTAVACFDDTVAAMLIRELEGRSISVPGDVSVIGFGQLPGFASVYPGLSTVSHPVEEHVRAAIRQVHGLIGGEATSESHLILSCRTVAGRTVGIPRNRII